VLGPNAEAADQLDIRVVATTKRILDGALQRAQVLGLAPSAVDFASATEAATPVEIVSLEADPVKATADRLRIVLAIGLVCSVAIGALGLYSVWDRQLQSDDLEAKIAIAQSRVAEVKRLNDENAALREQREHLVRRKTDDPAVIMLIEALSRALPDSAYLEELEIQGREARIVGKAADPTGLITTLEDTPEFEDVRFSAPTTREGHETLGTFSIVGRTQQGSSAEKKP
jgi:general secretion pathway protein L